MCTDRGQSNHEHPVEAMSRFISTLLEQGISERELTVMIHDVPMKVLGLVT